MNISKLNSAFFCLLFVLPLITITFSCQKSEPDCVIEMEEPDEMEEMEEIPDEMLHCYQNVDISDKNCENYDSTQDSSYCEPEYLGSFHHNELVQSIAKNYCSDSVQSIVFRNSANILTEFSIENFNYSIGRHLNNTNIICNSDSTKRTSYCYEDESYSIWLESIDLDLFLTLWINAQPIFVGSNKGKYYTRMQILKKKDSNSHTIQAKIVLDNGNSEYDYQNISSQEYYDTIVLNETQYIDVISDDISNNSEPTIKYYVSRINGLVAFQTTDGELYTLVE